MSARVSLSRKSARVLLDVAAGGLSLDSQAAHNVFGEIRKALKPKRSVSLRRKREGARKEKKNSETAAIRARCILRANNKCERCGYPPDPYRPLELDHFFGRVRVKQSERSCWILCFVCHRKKTANEPGATFWLEAFEAHARKHGYEAERRRAAERLVGRRLVSQASALPTQAEKVAP